MTSLRLSALWRVKETSLSYCKSAVADTVPRSRDHQIPRTHLSQAWYHHRPNKRCKFTKHRPQEVRPLFSFHVSSGWRFSFRTLELLDTTGTLKRAITFVFHIHAVSRTITFIMYATQSCVISAVDSRCNNEPRRSGERERERESLGRWRLSNKRSCRKYVNKQATN
jgi:hypothetical protein